MYIYIFMYMYIICARSYMTPNDTTASEHHLWLWLASRAFGSLSSLAPPLHLLTP